MIIYCESDGRVNTIPSTIPFGSAMREVTIIAPQTSASVALKIKPPNGEYQPDIVCSPELDANGMVVYTARLPKAIANRAGRAEYQVLFSMPNGEQIPTFTGTFNVPRGVMVDMPSTVEELSAYSIEQLYELLTNLTAINLKVSAIEDLVGVGKELGTISKNIIDAINEINTGGGGGGGTGGVSLLTVNITEGGNLTAEEFAQIEESPKSYLLQLNTTTADYILRYHSKEYTTLKYRCVAVNNGVVEQYLCTLNTAAKTYTVTKTMNGIEVDISLNKSGYPADAAKVGAELQKLREADASLANRVNTAENDISELERVSSGVTTKLGELDYTTTNLGNRVTALEQSGGGGDGNNDNNIVIDATLTQKGQAADAQATGNKILDLENDVAENASEITSVKDRNTAQDTRLTNLESATAEIPGIAADVTALQKEVAGINVAGAIAAHDTDVAAHYSIRKAVQDLNDKLSAFLDVDDTTKDQLSELLAMIANNETDIDAITSSMVKVADIVSALNVPDDKRPLSASAGMVLNQAIETLKSVVNGYANRITALENNVGASVVLTPASTCQEARTAFNDYLSKGKRLYWRIGIIDDVAEDAELMGYNNVNNTLFFFCSTYQMVITVDYSGVSSEAVKVTETVLGGEIDESIYDSISKNESDIANLKQQIEDINYKAITISGFRATTSVYEKGATVTSLNFTWSTNKTPKSLKFDGTTLTNTAKSHGLTGLSLTSGKSWTLVATDERDATASATASIAFYNGVYYGAKAAPTSIDSTFIKSLSGKELRSNYKPSFTADSGEGEYIWYCLPVSMGKRTFAINGFTGGFRLMPDANGNEYHAFTNAQGHTEDYYVYRTDFAALGNSRSITVS